ncbi:MAG: right-handed parallel beta-helix repeat-containing protein [Oscillospiraceae bacterium]|nr:right-handed parallel beta-helix repeat-containing protein [Oscillospiraceae bacterium]
MRKKLLACMFAAAALCGVGMTPLTVGAADVCCTVTADGQTLEYDDFGLAWSDAVTKSRSLQTQVSIQMMQDIHAKESFRSEKVVENYDAFKNGGLQLPSGTRIALDLNGHVLDRGLTNVRSQESSIVSMLMDSELTITDSNPDMVHDDYVQKGGILTGGYSRYVDASGIQMTANTKLCMNGGSFVNCRSECFGGAIGAKGFNYEDTQEYLGKSENQGKTVEPPVLEINGAGFYANGSDGLDGGAIFLRFANAVITNTIFDGNYAAQGGAVMVEKGASCQLENSYFYGNYAQREGGALYVDIDSESFAMDNCRFTFNRAENGGACYLDWLGKNTSLPLILKDNVLQYNHAEETGGALYASSSMCLSNCLITENTAGEHGGGVYHDTPADLSVQNRVVIAENTVKNKSDNVYLYYGVINCGGLEEGSAIYVSTDEDEEEIAVENASYYQAQNYLFADSGKKNFKAVTTKTEKLYTASAVGAGSLTAIVVGLTIMILGAALALLYKKGRVKKDAR